MVCRRAASSPAAGLLCCAGPLHWSPLLHVDRWGPVWGWQGCSWQELFSAGRVALPRPPFRFPLSGPGQKLAFVLFCFNNLNNWHRLHQPLGRQPMVMLSTWLGWQLHVQVGMGWGWEPAVGPQTLQRHPEEEVLAPAPPSLCSRQERPRKATCSPHTRRLCGRPAWPTEGSRCSFWPHKAQGSQSFCLAAQGQCPKAVFPHTPTCPLVIRCKYLLYHLRK